MSAAANRICQWHSSRGGRDLSLRNRHTLGLVNGSRWFILIRLWSENDRGSCAIVDAVLPSFTARPFGAGAVTELRIRRSVTVREMPG